MAYNFLKNTPVWGMLREDRRGKLEQIFEAMDHEYKLARGIAPRLAETLNCTPRSIARNLGAIKWLHAALKGEVHALEVVTSTEEATNESVLSARTWYAVLVENGLNETVLDSCESQEVESPQEGLQPSLLALFVDVQDRLLALKGAVERADSENLRLEARTRELELRNKLLEDALATERRNHFHLKMQMRSLIEHDSVVDELGQGDREPMFTFEFPTAACLPLGKTCTIEYRKGFLNALLALHPDQQKACVRSIVALAERGRSDTQGSQDHKIFRTERQGVPAPAGCRIARVSKKIRYLWGFEGENGEKKLVLYFVGTHEQVWDSEA